MKSGIARIAIVGAGVAGARLGHLLARQGREVLIFDNKAPWEKPCGGGLTPKVLRDFPELKQLRLDARHHHHLEIVSPRGRRTNLTIPRPLLTVSRQELGEKMLGAATAAGADFKAEYADGVEKRGAGVAVRAGGKEYEADLVVGADGTQSLVRRTFATPLAREDLCLAFGALLPVAVRMPIIIRFFEGFFGYAWIFPRRQTTSVGIALEQSGLKRDAMAARLREFVMEEWEYAAEPIPNLGQPWAWLLPALRPESFAEPALAGDGWALIGDASGSADPLTGEGIYYALKTADLLAEAIAQDRLETYAPAWKTMTASIGRVSSMRYRFYRPFYLRLLGLMLDYSPSARQLARELLVGEQQYLDLKPRVLSEWPLYLKDALMNAMLFRKGERD